MTTDEEVEQSNAVRELACMVRAVYEAAGVIILVLPYGKQTAYVGVNLQPDDEVQRIAVALLRDLANIAEARPPHEGEISVRVESEIPPPKEHQS